MFPRHDRPRPGRIPAPPAPSSSLDDDLGFLFAEIVRDLPEFVPRYLDLTDSGDDDPGEPRVLMELADFVADRLSAVETEASALARALGIVESHLATREDDDVTAALVGLAFFDSFTVEDRQRMTSHLGPRSLELLESLELGPTHEDR